MKKYIYKIGMIRGAFFLLCMMLCSTVAWAQDGGEPDPEPVLTPAQKLINALTEGADATVYYALTEDVNLGETIELNANKTITLDLAGHSIVATGRRALWIKSGSVTITSTVAGGTISVVNSIDNIDSSVIRVGDKDENANGASLEIDENVTIKTDLCYGVTVFGTNASTLTVNGKIATKVRSAVSGNGSAGLAPTTITIGEKAEITTTNEVAIYHPQAGTLTVKGGAKVTGAGGIEMKGGKLVVEADAEIKATDAPTHTAKNDDPSTRGYAIAIVESGAGYPGVSTVNISKDAKIDGEIAVLQDSEHEGASPIDFTGDVKMLVKVTKDDKIIGQYMSLNEAFREGIPAGSTITLYGDCSLTSTITTTNGFTLALNGHRITSSGKRAFHIQSGDVIIQSTEAGGVISVPTIDNNDKSVIRVGSDDASDAAVSLTVKNGVTISADECYGITIFGKNTTESLVVYGKVDTKIRSAISGNGTNGLASTNITIGSTAEITTTDDAAIYHPQAGTLTVESGAKVTGSTGIEMKGGTLDVKSSAEITATGTPSHTKNNDGTSTRGYAIAIVENNAGYGAGAGVTAVTIADGAIINGAVSQLQDSSIGSFSPTVKKGDQTLTTIAAIDGVKFFTLKEAIDIVPVNGTVALLGDLTLTSPFKMDVNKTYTFDLAGYTLTGSGCAAIQVADGSVTIDNSGSDEKTISVNSSAAPAVILLGDDAGDNRNVSLTINNKVKVESTVSDGILVSGTTTRETLIVKGSIAASGYAIKGADQSEKIEVAAGGSVSSSGAIAIYHPQSGDLVIEGTVQGTGGIEMKGGNLTVNAGAKITATAGATSHTPNAAAPSTNGYAIALVENENFPGVGKVNIKSAATITGVIANLVDSENTQVAATVFNGDIVMVAETKNANNFAERYAKLSDAVTAALAGADVKIIDDIIVTETVGINKAVKLIMNDHSIIGKQTSGSTLAISGGVTLEDGGIIAEQGEGISISGGTVSLNQMTVKAAGSSLNVSGGTVTADKKSSFTSSTGNTVAFSGGTLTISGAVYNTASTAVAAIAATGTAGALTINDKAVVSSANCNAIDWQNAGTLNITSGNIISDKAIAIYANSGTVTINGGTFTGKVNALKIYGENCTPSVVHGTFSSTEEDPIVSTDKVNFVQGDYFSKPIEQSLCASGYTVAPNPKSNGMFYLINEIVITDATHWIVRDDDYTIGTAKYVRSSGMGVNGTKFGTLCLPFSFSATQTDMTFYAVSEIQTEVLILTPVTGTTIEAGTPVVFQLTEAAQGFEIASTNATIPGGETNGYPKPANNLVGTYTNTDITEGLTSIYYLNGDAFHKAAAKLTVPAFRAYIKLDSGSGTGAKSRTLAIRIEGEDATGIDNNMIDLDTFEEVYDMQGRKQDGLQKGMNIMRTKDGRTIKVYVNK
ncbi:MAG: hypothetical protein MJZ36_02960 [Bacteroidaceae bacterium]|nr:hypothetical protein [Bacteroidaceae bacterium]